MRTTLNIDDQALTEAMKTEPDKTKTDLINEALREFVRRRKIRDLLKLEGKMQWEGDLDELRRRKGRRVS